MHHKSMYLEDQRDAVLSSLYLFTAKSLYMFRVSPTTSLWSWPFGHDQSQVTARPWTLFNRILSLHLQTDDLYQWL